MELLEKAVADAIAGAARNESPTRSFFAGDMRLALPELVKRAGRPDVVVVDPPRAGLSKKVVQRHYRVASEADRLRVLQPDDAGPERGRNGGGRMVAGAGPPVDMFPQTHHIECVALLERG